MLDLIRAGLLTCEAASFSLARRMLFGRAREMTALLSARRTLVIAPHPDDETLGCGAAIARLRQSGQAVRVLIVTDGRGSHSSAVIDAQELVNLREAEAVAACACLGLAASEVRFLHFRDGGLTDCVDQLAACLDAEVAAFAPEQILYPCGIDLHPDHRAVATAVERLLKAAGQAPPAYAYPVWFWKLRPWISRPGFLAQLPRLRPVKVSAGEFIGRKRAAIDEHRSQVKSLTAEDGRQVLSSAFTGHFLDAYELFFEFVPAPSWRPTGR